MGSDLVHAERLQMIGLMVVMFVLFTYGECDFGSLGS